MLCALPSHILVMIMDSHELQLREEVSSDFQSFQHQCHTSHSGSLLQYQCNSRQWNIIPYHALRNTSWKKMVSIRHFTNYLSPPPSTAFSSPSAATICKYMLLLNCFHTRSTYSNGIHWFYETTFIYATKYKGQP